MLISFIRTMILYTILIVVIRLMGKRQLGEMEPMEFVVTMLLANLAAVPMQETGIPLLSGLIPILVDGAAAVCSGLSQCRRAKAPLRQARHSDGTRQAFAAEPQKDAHHA